MSRYVRTFGRRQFLVGAGGLLAMPMLESLISRHARAAVNRAVAADSPQRLVLFHSCHGWHTDKWVPTQVGADFPLSQILQPLQNVKDKTLVFSKMQNDAYFKCQAPNGFDTHARGNATLFTGANVIPGNSVQVGPSMDQIFAQSIAGKTPVASLQLGLPPQGDPPNSYPQSLMQCVSYADKNTALVDQLDPVAVFDKYFAGATTSGGQQAQVLLRQQRKSVLDGVLDQANALKPKLGVDDAARLDQYFSGVRALEMQFSALTNASCAQGARPAVSNEQAYDVRAYAFMDLITLAFSCDLTRSVCFNFGSGHNDHRYNFVDGGVSGGHHAMTHDEGSNGVPAMIDKVNTWEVSVAARMLEGLKKVPEGTGTMLDNALAFISSEDGVPNHHSPTDIPVVLIGGAGGKVVGNRHVQLGSNNGYGNLTEVQLAVLQALGCNLTSFGGFNTTRAASLTA